MANILFRIKGTVILKIWRKLLFVVLYTTGVLFAERFVLGWEVTSERTINSKEITSLIVIFGLFTGFLLVFRTNTAYDRYWEGRKLWSTVILNIRILTRVIWTMVPYDRLSFWRLGFQIQNQLKKHKKTFRPKKRRACSTTCLVKRNPRAKPSVKFAKHAHASVRRSSIISRASKVAPTKFNTSIDSLGDLYPTDSSIENSRSSSPSSKISTNSRESQQEKDELYKPEIQLSQKYPKISTNKLIIEQISAINLLIAFAYATKNFLRGNHSYTEPHLQKLIKHVPHFQAEIEQDQLSKQLKLGPPQNMRNIPVEISHLIMSYIKSIREQQIIDDPTSNILNHALDSLVECLAQFEKILKTPIPLAYSVHLHHAIWLYFLATPYQLIELLDWWTIPVVGMIAFAMFGILDIGWEIENPFGVDDNDLPMDMFCRSIHHETLNIIANPMPPAETWIFSKYNFPLMNKSNVSAKQLINLTEENIRDILTWYGSQPGKSFY